MEEIKVKNQDKDRKIRLVSYIFLICLVALLGIVLIYFGFAQKETKNIIFNETGEADYKVYLKDNDYYKEPYLEKGMSYVASLIDYIKLDFNYNLNSSKESDLDYKYKITAELIITERGEENKILFRRPIVLKEEIEDTASTNGVINETLNIKYDDYNAMVNNYKKEYALSVSSKLLITMHIDSNAKATNTENSNFTSSNDITVSIPLSEQTIEINLNSNTINNSKEVLEYSSFNPLNYIYLAIGIILIIVLFILVAKCIDYLKARKQAESEYTKKKNSILREYDRFIVETSKIEETKKYNNTIYVKSFNELLDARDNVEKPILFKEDVIKKVSTFSVIDDNNNIYIYKISENNAKR